MIFLTPAEVAAKLKKSLRWVYNHAADLGAARIGKSLIFTEEGLIDAIQRGQEVEGVHHSQKRQKDHQAVHNQERGQRVGIKHEEGLTEAESAIRARFLDSLHQVC